MIRSEPYSNKAQIEQENLIDGSTEILNQRKERKPCFEEPSS